MGYYTSITIGSDGLGLISYYDKSNGDLKVAHCGNPACTKDPFTPTVEIELGLLPPSVILDDNMIPSRDALAYAHRNAWVSEATVTKFFIATETGSYDIGYSLAEPTGGEVDIVVTRHVPVVPLPGAGDTNGDNNVDVLDLVTVGSNPRAFGPE